MTADPAFKAGFTDLSFKDSTVHYADMPGIWGVPFSSVAGGFFYNTELFKKAGISDVPKTWDDLVKCVEKLKAIDVIPWAIGAKDGWRVEHLYSAVFYRLNGVAAAYKLADRSMKYSDPDAIAPWTEIRKLSDMGAFGPEPASVDFGTEMSLFQNGKAGMNFSLSAFINSYNGDESAIKGKVGFFSVPVFAGKEQYARNNFGGGEAAYGIAKNATPEQIEAAWLLCKAISGPEGQAIVANANATMIVNTKAVTDPAKANPLFKPFSEEVSKADAVMTDVCNPDTVATLLAKIRDVGVAVVNKQLTPNDAGKEIDAEIADNK